MTDRQAKELTLKRFCPTCGGEGGLDSGGETPWGAAIYIPCPSCKTKHQADIVSYVLTGHPTADSLGL